LIDATFVRSIADATGLPRDGLSELAVVGRSNVGKSSLINALLRQRLARTSATPGKTRLANLYRVARGSAPPFYVVDLPGYGFARGGSDAAFAELTGEYFGREGQDINALLLVDARHPGLESDAAAWRWLVNRARHAAIAATKIDKLARGERIRATRELESVHGCPVLPVSAATGEGLEELWKLIDKLVTPD
jgi:GTP-binding protein